MEAELASDKEESTTDTEDPESTYSPNCTQISNFTQEPENTTQRKVSEPCTYSRYPYILGTSLIIGPNRRPIVLSRVRPRNAFDVVLPPEPEVEEEVQEVKKERGFSIQNLIGSYKISKHTFAPEIKEERRQFIYRYKRHPNRKAGFQPEKRRNRRKVRKLKIQEGRK